MNRNNSGRGRGREGGGRGGRGRGRGQGRGRGGREGRGRGQGGRGRGGNNESLNNRDDDENDAHDRSTLEGNNNNRKGNSNTGAQSNSNNNRYQRSNENNNNENSSNNNRNKKNNNNRQNKKKKQGREPQQQEQQHNDQSALASGDVDHNNNNSNNNSNNNNKQTRRRRRGNNNYNDNTRNFRGNSSGVGGRYEDYWAYKTCLERYFHKDPDLIRGRLRVMPGGPKGGGKGRNTNDNNENNNNNREDAATAAFCSCDRGSLSRDVVIQTEAECNRALDGDTVWVQLLPLEDGEEDDRDNDRAVAPANAAAAATKNDEHNHRQNDPNHRASARTQTTPATTTWQDDPIQMKLWNPLVPVPKKKPDTNNNKKRDATGTRNNANISNNGEEEEEAVTQQQVQRRGRVVYVEPPKSVAHQPSEIHPSEKNQNKSSNKNDNNYYQYIKPRRTIVGTLRTLQSGTCLLTPTNRSLPQFVCNNLPQYFVENELHEEREVLRKQQQEEQKRDNEDRNNRKNNRGTNNTKITRFLYQAEYVYYTWKTNHQWPPCANLKRIGQSFSVQDEIKTLLLASDVDHGEFPPRALEDVENAVRSGLFLPSSGDNNHNNERNDGDAKKNENQEEEKERSSSDNDNNMDDAEMGWRPTKDMYAGRRDLRKERIFTIDPTTAKDLDDALHIKQISKNRVEIGVHIADVSHFVKPGTAIDTEAQRRATTVYLVDRTVPMLPRPLCEIACSLNENVERLAFSCIWTMNLDGSMGGGGGNNDDGGTIDIGDNNVWYGRTVIKSCARLDYATAQNIIDEKVAHGESEEEMDEMLWPKSRRPVVSRNKNKGEHDCYDVAKDVRLMHRVGMGRRRQRFESGALALHGIKLTFQLDPMDHEKPLLCQPYPIRDSNRLVEEFMLLANYLVAQRLVMDSGPLAVLRNHPPPVPEGLDKVADIAYNAMGFRMDVSSSETLHDSLCRLERLCNDNTTNNNGIDGKLVLQCITQMLMTPMQAAEYFVVGKVPQPEGWGHFALNIPYYTHFTSPIRRYPDIMVHRLLQEAIDNENNNDDDNNNDKKNNDDDDGDDDGKNTNDNDDDDDGDDDGKNTNDNDDDDEDSGRFDAEKMQIEEFSTLCTHCNEKKMASKEAQERCDRVFLALYVHHSPLKHIQGIVLSVGKKTFTVYIPSLGFDSLIFLDEHKDTYDFDTLGDAENGEQRRIVITPKKKTTNAQQEKKEDDEKHGSASWTKLEIRVFAKLRISCFCKDEPPIDVKVKVEGPWTEDEEDEEEASNE